jgi:hypothetical protein
MNDVELIGVLDSIKDLASDPKILSGFAAFSLS